MNTLFKPTSYKKGAAVAVGATFVWKVVSFANALLLALYFGADRQTDIYFYLIMLTGLATLFFQNLTQVILIPEAIFLTRENETKARQFTTMWLYIYGAVGLVAGLVGLVCPEQIWQLLSRFEGPVLAADKWMLKCGFALFALQNISLYLIAVAEMYKFFKTAWLSVLNALCPLLFLLLLGRQIGIISMVYGFIMANLVQIVILLLLLKTQLTWSFSPAWVPLRVQTRQNMLTGQLLAVFSIFTGWLPVYLMSSWGAGIVSALTYCKQFTDSTNEIFVARTANVAKIQLTELIAQKKYAQADQTFLASAYALLALLAPLVVFSCYFAPQIVQVFLERGQFGAQATQYTATFLRPMLFNVLLFIPGALQNSALAAGRKIKEWFPYSLLSTIVYTLFLWIEMPRWGAFSFPYLLAAAGILGFVLNAFLFKKHLPFLQYAKQLGLVVRFTLVATVPLIPAVALSWLLPANAWIQLAVCGSIYVAGYGAVLYVTKDLQKLFHVATDNF